MRVVSYRSDRGVRAGLLRDDSVVDVWDAIEGDGSSVRDLLAGGRLAEAAEISGGEPLALAEVELEPPVPDPDKIICIGLNYRAHAAGLDLVDVEAVAGAQGGLHGVR